MRISEILVHRVNIRLEAPYRWVPGWSHGHTKGIVEMHTDEGIVGFGEVATLDDADYLERRMARQLVGLDPLDLDGCLTACVPEHGALSNLLGDEALRVFGGVELALWDIRGKQLGAPPARAARGAGTDGGPLLRVLLLPPRPRAQRG
jgi:glucarate dehydratase